MHEHRAPVDAALFRRVMSRFATGVTIITADGESGVRGMTANAFMSGSLTPPLCLVSVSAVARMHEYLLTAGHFGVSILAEGQEAISTHFAGRRVTDLTVDFERVAHVPFLRSASAVIAAEIEASHSCGDHTLFIGRIIHMRVDDREPLVYHGGRYGAFVPSTERAIDPITEFW